VDRDRQIGALTEIVGALANQVGRAEARVNLLAKRVTEQDQHRAAGQDPDEPAYWVLDPPPATVNRDDGTVDIELTLSGWVAWYNATYTGVESGRARPIPACWREHSGLAMEIASLAAAWLAANVGPTATPRDAQHWHHQSRPGFAERTVRDWVRQDCLDGIHHSDPEADSA
jgi:hypothetical protein